MSTYLVTGAGRGIGLELTKQLEKLDGTQVSKIFATTRGQPSDALAELIAAAAGRVIHIPCDVNKPESIASAVTLLSSELSGKGLDVLVNNVGVSTFPSLNVSSWSPITPADIETPFRPQPTIKMAYVPCRTLNC
jgi:NAD(P)-dependent dehydrogenase (short-subunit alcohol dehydrogenase family)